MIRRLRWLAGLLVAVHLAVLGYGIARPEAILQFDRTGQRMGSARRLLETPSLELLLSRGVPGDYAFHAAVLGATGGWLPAVPIVQLLLAALAIALVYQLVWWLEGRRDVAALAAVFYAAIPIDFMVPHFLASEAFFNPLLVFGTVMWARYVLRTPDVKTLALAGIAFALAALTRTESLPWMLVMLGFTAVVALRAGRGTAAAHVPLLALLTGSGVCLWLALAPTPPVDLGKASVSLQWELANRASRVIVAGGGEATGIEAAPVAAFVRAITEHPVAFAREWVLQTGKLLALPDNLDAFRYFGLYEYTGQRSELVHSQGIWGAAKSVFAEMPVLASWLVASIAIWLVFFAFALRGAWHAIRGSRGGERIVYALLLSLPVIWTALRVLTQGESRKRSPVDFALAIFAAIGVMRSRAS